MGSTILRSKMHVLKHFILHCYGRQVCTELGKEGSDFWKHLEFIVITWLLITYCGCCSTESKENEKNKY